MTTAQDIIKAIEDKYLNINKETIKNCSDLNIQAKIKHINQYVIGVTTHDGFAAGIDRYENEIKMELSKISREIDCLAWSFDEEETNQLKTVLEELSQYFHANLEVDKMITNAKRYNRHSSYYIVITVVQIPVLYAE